MKCPYCGEEMIRGYLMSARDITFVVDNLTKVFRIKKSDDLELSKGSEGIPHCEAYRCSSCKKILIDYANRYIVSCLSIQLTFLIFQGFQSLES